MQFIFRRRYCHRSFSADSTATATKWVRERGLDHAVEREKNLKPLLNIKNLIKSEPSKSLPITIVAQQRDSLKIPIRPVDFVRRYPTVFQEFLPGNIGVHPHVKLTPEILNLDAEEQLVYQSETYKKVVADRLLKLLMISRISEIPLQIIDILKWDLGLPQDYDRSIVPDFPDCFRIVGGEKGREFAKLELVCWSSELAVSVVEKKAVDGEKVMFPMKFSNGVVIDKKMKKYLDDWQKLPYISPYDNASHVLSKSDESDKWAVAVLHELLSLFVAKKAERDNVFCLGEYLGIRSRFKRVLFNFPGIFYVSSKIGTYTVVLREGYKRGSLIESDPLMNVRSQYIHLMNKVKEDRKVVALQSGNKQRDKGMAAESKGEGEDVSGNGEEEKDVESGDLNGSEEEDVSDDVFEEDDDEEEEEEDMQRRGSRKTGATGRGRMSRKMNFDKRRASRNSEGGRSRRKHREEDVSDDDFEGDDDDEEEEGEEDMHRRGSHKNGAIGRGRTSRKMNFDTQGTPRNPAIGNSRRKHHENAKEEVPAKYPRRRERHGETNVRGNCENAKEEIPAKYPRRERHGETNVRGISGERFNSNRSRRISSENKFSI